MPSLLSASDRRELRVRSDGLVAKGPNESNAPRSVGTLGITHHSARTSGAK